jgi:L-rhamnonate dehydratase
MKIKEIKSVRLEFSPRAPELQPRPPVWIQSEPIANTMSRYPRYAFRPSWYPSWETFGCLVTAEDGTWGFGTAQHGRPVAAIIDDYLGPLLIGEPCLAIDRLYDIQVRLCAPFGATGLAAYAVSAIDLALWDLKGKLLQRPVYELLGGPARDEVVCYATGLDTKWYLELGFQAVKIPCPYGPADGKDGLRKNVETVSQHRELVGPEKDLMLDCWMSFDVEYAVRLAEELRPFKLKWIEETLPPEDLDGHAQLRDRLPWQTLATGEHWFTTYPFQYAASHHLVDILQPDICWVGGMTPLVKICAIAEAAGISVIPHASALWPYALHACYALPAIPWAEYVALGAAGVPLDQLVSLPGTPVPVDGRLQLSDAPGFGLELSSSQLVPFHSNSRP